MAAHGPSPVEPLPTPKVGIWQAGGSYCKNGHSLIPKTSVWGPPCVRNNGKYHHWPAEAGDLVVTCLCFSWEAPVNCMCKGLKFLGGSRAEPLSESAGDWKLEATGAETLREAQSP